MRMSKAKLRVLLTEWQTEQDGLIECPGCCERLKPKYFHIDHIQPKIGGGVDRIENRILLCGPCNLAKGDRLPCPDCSGIMVLVLRGDGQCWRKLQ